MKKLPFFSWERLLPPVLVIAALFGLVASFTLTYEKLQLLENPNHTLSCNINPILSCASVMTTPQAEFLGIPNPVFGLVIFSLLLAFGVMLWAGAVMPRRIWLAAQAAAVGGVLFMHFLFFSSMFVIHAICPWCFGVWMITILVFWGITIHNIRARNFGERFARSALARFADMYGAPLLITWYLVIFIIILVQFWDYWSTLL